MCAVVLCVLACGLSGPAFADPPSTIAQPGAGAAADPGTVVAPTVSASFKWSVPEHYPASWFAWQASRATYKASYVRTKGWPVTLDGCGSKGAGQKITSYEWTIRGVTDKTFSTHRIVSACKLHLNSGLPDQGRYDVTLVVKTRGGASDSVTHPVQIKDWLVVSIGDSFSSGEGNPDRRGSYTRSGILALACKGGTTGDSKRALWKDRSCHRSALSAPAITAEHLERRDDKSSVTFLSFACSGATTEHLMSKRYEGMEPAIPNQLLDPQIEAVKKAVGATPIDVLLVTIGINDLSFSDVITECATPQSEVVRRFWSPADDSCIGSGLQRRIDGLMAKYAMLADAIKRDLTVREVYIVEYPRSPLEDNQGQISVCECLDVGNAGINDNDFDYLGFAGRRLSSAIAQAARAHGWNYINGVTDVFKGHNYCASGSERFYRRVTESVQLQGPRHGGLHPNEKGHRAVRDLMVSAVQLGTNTRATHRVTVSFDRVKAGSVDNGSMRSLFLSMTIEQRLKQPFRDFLSNVPPLYQDRFSEEVPNGRWVDLPRGKYGFTFDVFAAPNPPRYVSDFDITTVGNGKNRSLTSVANLSRFGEGTHILVTPEQIDDPFGIEFKISVDDLLPFDPMGPDVTPTDQSGGSVQR